MELLTDKKPDGDRAEFAVLQKQNPQLRQVLARALDHNAANATAASPFPRELESLRKPLAPLRPRPEKPVSKPGE
jgi:UDP-N-acetylmuramate-alanine ligase